MPRVTRELGDRGWRVNHKTGSFRLVRFNLIASFFAVWDCGLDVPYAAGHAGDGGGAGTEETLSPDQASSS